MEVKTLKLSSVHPSPMNPRKTFDDVALKELSENIRQQGLLQPITVRPVADNSDYEIVCGERRYRAYRILSEEAALNNELPFNPWEEIMAIVKKMSDEEAFDAMITENLQRQDVDPMEEAFAFSQLQKNGSLIQDIALRFGKSIRFVQDRIKLNSLIPELMKALKEEKMPISAAMIICKVTEEQQRMYYKQYSDNYQGFTTATASGFVKGLFRNLTDAVWNQQPDYAGGCDTSCGECLFNTCNHGCLFYEMKSSGGQCTCEDKFIAKTVAYIADYLRSNDDTLVKAGQPLEKGKAVITLGDDSYAPGIIKKLKESLRAKVKELGYEMVDPSSQFKGRCWYDIDDERTQAFLKSGECYRVIQLGQYNYIRIEQQAWYLKKNDQITNVDSNGLPIKVQELVNKYKSEKTTLPSTLISQGCKALGEHGHIKDLKGLDNSEFVLAYSMMVKNNRELCNALGLGDYPSSEEITSYVAGHLDMAPFILRAWMKHALHVGTTILSLDEVKHLAKSHIDRLGEIWCPDEYQGIRDKVKEKFSKSKKKIASQLKALGYTLDGKKIESEAPAAAPTPAPTYANLDKQYKEMKKKHPNSILIFRVNDFYELFNEDAEKAAEVLKITITKRGNKMVAGFPHHALDTYLPKLIHAGLKVALCEQLENPKKGGK